MTLGVKGVFSFILLILLSFDHLSELSTITP